MKTLADNICLVLDRIKAQVQADEDDAAVYAEVLDSMLDELLGQDFFGTEGQCDPRGDQRNSGVFSGNFSVYEPEVRDE